MPLSTKALSVDMRTMDHHGDLDRGYAWIVLIACIIAQSFEHISTAGIFYMAIFDKYQKGRKNIKYHGH